MYRLNIEAFVTDEESEAQLKLAMANIALFRSQMIVHRGDIDLASEHYAQVPTPDVVIVQSDDTGDGVDAQLSRFSEVVGPSTQVIMVGRINTVPFYRGVLDMGVASYLVHPITSEDFLRSLRDIYGKEKDEERGRVIAVMGTKGGIGSSTVAHNLAASLARIYGRPTSLVDLDVHYGTATLAFNVQPKFGLRDALAQAERIDESTMERYFTKDIKGYPNLWLLASSPSMGDIGLMQPETLEPVIDEAAKMSTFVVLDVPHTWNSTISNTLLVVDELVIVAEPDLAGMHNAQLIIEALGVTRPKGTATRCVLANVGLNKGTEETPKRFADEMNIVPSVAIPWDPVTFRAALTNGQLVSEIKGKAKVATLFDDLAKVVAGREPPPSAVPGKQVKAGFLAGMFASKPK